MDNLGIPRKSDVDSERRQRENRMRKERKKRVKAAKALETPPIFQEQEVRDADEDEVGALHATTVDDFVNNALPLQTLRINVHPLD